MLRRIRTILCVFSLLLALALLIAWPLSYKQPRGLFYKRTESVPIFSRGTIDTPHFYFATIQNGKVSIGHWRSPTIIQMMKTLRGHTEKQLAELQRVYEEQSTRLGGMRASFELDIQKISQALADLNRFFCPDGLHIGADPLQAWDRSTPQSFAGVSYRRFSDPNSAALIHRVVIPIWLILLILLLPPLLWGLSHYRAFLHRRRAGHCPTCGYDLRATPIGGLCPECGHTTPNPAAAVTITRCSA